jgi:hypothetical protein
LKVTPDGVVKLLDFGLAKAFSPELGEPQAEARATDSPTLTMGATVAGVILGTASYMAPEQARGKRVDKRADIWSWGVVLYELFTGERMFHGEDAAETLAAVIHKPPDLERVPPQVRKLLRRCLEKDPRQRLRDIGEARYLLDEPTAPASAPSRSRFSSAVIAALAVIAAGAGWIAWRATRPMERPLMQLSAELGPDTSLALLAGGSIALSPDGTLLALTVRGADGQVRLGTRRIDASKINILAGTEGAQAPFFSPDGRWIAFSNSGGLQKISAQGGAPVSLSNTFSLGGSWGDDGTIIAVTGIGTGLSRIREGGAPVPLTEIKPLFIIRWPQVLPGSQAVMFRSNDTTREDPDDADIDVISLKTRERKTLYHGGFFARYLPSGHLVFIHRNTLFAAPFDLKRLALTGVPQPVIENIHNGFDQGGDFDFSQNGILVYLNGSGKLRQSIFWLDSAGHLQPLQPTPGLCTFPRFSPDGKHLAYSLDDGQGHTDIWVRDLDRDTPRQLTSLPGRNSWPVWTADSKGIIFEAVDPAAGGIYWMRSDGSGAPLILTKERSRPESVSPDGKWLLVIQFAGLGRAILQAPIEGDSDHPTLGKAAPFLTRTLSVLQTFSRDGRWVASITADPANRGIWVQPFPGPGGQWKIDSAGLQPVWSRIGNELFYMSVTDGRIMAVSYTASDNTFTWYKPRVWSERRLLDLGPSPTYDVAPDGKRLAVVLYEDGTAEEKPITHVTYLLNFLDELRRRVPLNK